MLLSMRKLFFFSANAVDFIFVNGRQIRELSAVSVGQFINDTDFNGAVERGLSLSKAAS